MVPIICKIHVIFKPINWCGVNLDYFNFIVFTKVSFAGGKT